MTDRALNTVRSIAQWSTILLSIVFRNQFSVSAMLRSIGGFMIVFGVTLAIWGRVTLGQAFTSSLAPKGFVTNGIYAKLRHPMYTGGALLFLGLGLLFQSFVGLILTGLLVVPLLVYAAIAEEREMIGRFGEAYIDYKRNTVF